ncbi:MAG: stage 0 sporulation family protein [Candidatus Omnitrophica bacterium]|nr:stage 0 sporulation family protein [Candidatus Omnitrophota bacterium]
MQEVVQVRLREAGGLQLFFTNGLKFNVGDYVIVEADRGLDYGQIAGDSEMVLEKDLTGETPRKIIRKTNPWDHSQIEKNKKKAKELMDTCYKRIEAHTIPMKLIESEYSFDRSKIIFYFTAENRIDFRELVKDLANTFRARIELKQIGVRDEARILGGFGPCGRELCCAKFLKDFQSVTIKMAKDQNLSLNPTKISGLCGRLMCCLDYEYTTYRECLKGLPRAGQEVKTDKGKARVISTNPLKRTVTVKTEDGNIVDLVFKDGQAIPVVIKKEERR